MTHYVAAGIAACVVLLSGCASQDTSLIAIDTSGVPLAPGMMEKGDDIITGSRIPAASTDRLLRRVGNKEYRVSQSGQANPMPPKGKE